MQKLITKQMTQCFRLPTMLNRLNGWQRIGAVLTASWLIFILLIGAIGYSNFENGNGPFVVTTKGRVAYCTTQAPNAASDKKTITLEEAYGCAPGALVEGTPDRKQFMWEAVAAAAIIPVVLLWVLAYMLIAVIRWVAKGFNQ